MTFKERIELKIANILPKVMLIETPPGLAKGEASLQFVIAFTQDGEQQTEMGRVDSLPI